MAETLILASASPRREALLTQAGFTPAHILPAEIDEKPQAGELPRPYVQRMAEEKALTISKTHPKALVLGSDTVVTMGRRILPKAETDEQAKACLRKLSGRRHQVFTAIALAQGGVLLQQRTVETVVRFKRLSKPEIAEYLASGEWHGKAGGYAIQGRAACYVQWLRGSYSAVVGLPLHETSNLLRAHGVLPGDDTP